MNVREVARGQGQGVETVLVMANGEGRKDKKTKQNIFIVFKSFRMIHKRGPKRSDAVPLITCYDPKRTPYRFYTKR